MPHRRDPLKTEERPWRAAQRQGRGKGTEPKNSTESVARDRARGGRA